MVTQIAKTVLLTLIAQMGCSDKAEVIQDGKSYGEGHRILWTTSRVVGSPDPLPRYKLQRAFTQFSFDHPVFISQDPESERLFVSEYGGKIYSFSKDDPTGTKDLFLDMKRRVSAFSFHPQYAFNGQVFVFSPTDPDVESKKAQEVKQLSRVSRFQRKSGSYPPRLNPESEKIIIEWPAGGHNGGEAIMGPDGYLYIATGDGTGENAENTGQDLDDLLAAMLRIDVDNPDLGLAYSIPDDNPFIGMQGVREEIWSYGFRNPWRFSFDPETGRPWVGDVGQDLWEMIHLSNKGSNHGWSVMEGLEPYHPNSPRGPTPIVPPVTVHHHREGRSITGGYVYQGEQFPELQGTYLYGDYQYGKVWGIRYDHKSEKVIWKEELVDSTVQIVSFGLGRDGSFYAVDYGNGGIYQLKRRPPGTIKPRFPENLSETGLFQSVANNQVTPGVIPYSVNVPFWSDGADKDRFLALPGKSHIQFKEEGAWQFEGGTVAVKSFALEMETGNPSSRQRIETRIMVKQDDHWAGYTYAWNNIQSEAKLVEAQGLDQTYTIRDLSVPGGLRQQVWHYPSRQECMFCHSRAAGFILGLNTRQMNRQHDHQGTAVNQLQNFNQLGIFQEPLQKAVEEYPSLPNPFGEEVNLEKRVKTYLQVNCAMCHVPSGGGNSRMNLAYKTAMENAHLINELPIQNDMGLSDARLVAPGDPNRSVLFQRFKKRGPNQMPPTSTNQVDPRGSKLLEEWILHLKPHEETVTVPPIFDHIKRDDVLEKGYPLIASRKKRLQ